VARLVWRVAARQLRPLRPGTKNPKHPSPYLPPLTARAAPAVLPAGWVRDQRIDTLPLGVREIQGDLPTRGAVAMGGTRNGLTQPIWLSQLVAACAFAVKGCPYA